MPSGSNGFLETVRQVTSLILRGWRRCCSTPGRPFTWRESPRPSPKGSAARVKLWRRAPRARPSIGCGKRRLVFPDDPDHHSLDDDIPLVETQRLERIVGRLQPDPPTGFAVEAFHRGALSMDQCDHGLAGVGLIVFVDRGQRLEPELAGDLLEARGVPLFLEVFRDVIEDLALAPRDRHTGSRRFTEPKSTRITTERKDAR